MSMTLNRVLVVDDDPVSLAMMESILTKNGYEPTTAGGGREGLRKLDELKPKPAMIFLDVMMPDLDGFSTFKLIRKNEAVKDIPIIFITATSDQAAIQQCFQIGGADYISKPVRETELLARMGLHLALERRKRELDELEAEHAMLKDRLLSGGIQEPEAFHEILTVSSKMQAIFQYIESISLTTRPVFITGETGTGKELVAKATDALSGRGGKFVPLNVAGLDDNLFSDTLFGHVKGAFTGAMADRSGLIEAAAGGTLFLDEIGDLDMLSQVKLLRLLQEGEYYPLGADQRKWSDARIVVATHQSIQRMVEEGKFRKDLYYRLRTHHVHIPPLRDRKCDLPLLMEHFLQQAAESLSRPAPTPPKDLIRLLESYSFPGNIRELEGMVFDAVSRSTGTTMSRDAFESAIARSREEGIDEISEPMLEPVAAMAAGLATNREDVIDTYLDDRFPTLKEISGLLITKALDRTNGNQALAANMLGLSRQALNKRLKRKSDDAAGS